MTRTMMILGVALIVGCAPIGPDAGAGDKKVVDELGLDWDATCSDPLAYLGRHVYRSFDLHASLDAVVASRGPFHQGVLLERQLLRQGAKHEG